MTPKMSKQPAADEAELYAVVRRIRPLYRALVAAVDEQLQGTGISVALRGMLERLDEAGPQTVPQIARALGVGRQFVQRSMDEAALAGLVHANDNPAHQRSPLFELTRKGQAAFVAARRREQAVTGRIAKGLARADVAAAERVVIHMIEGFAGRPPRRLK